MSSPFLGEIKMVSFNFAPKGFALASGQLLPINQNQALFSLFGTTYGGNGQTTFAIPNLQGRTALHFGNSPSGTAYTIGQSAGEANHALVISEMPNHTHTANVSTGNGVHAPSGAVLPGSGAEPFYDPTATVNANMSTSFIANAGQGQGHENRMPYLTINFVVALQGIFPSRN